MTERRPDVRNVAIIAHVDHGKTTLVDALLVQCGAVTRHGTIGSLLMDSGDQERERGITIQSKICSVSYRGVRLNVIDTPGHADFGGEVERVLRLADGAILLVDAAEGPMPQTRFVLQKALQGGLKPVLVVNKIDKDAARPKDTVDQVFDLMVELGASDWQLDFPILYGVGRSGWMVRELDQVPGADLKPLLDTVLEAVPGPPVALAEPLRLQIADIAYNDFVGRIGVGRISAGRVAAGQDVIVVRSEGVQRRARVLQLHRASGLEREELRDASAGEIVQLTGIDGIDISDTVCDPGHPVSLPRIAVDEPTIRMRFGVNSSPLAGREGKPLQSRELGARLARECERNVALRVQPTDQNDVFDVAGRGLLHLSVLIETLRREGCELQVGAPRVILRQDDQGNDLEPIERVLIDVPEEHAGRAMNLLYERRGEMEGVQAHGKRQQLTFTVPSRGLFGLRTQLLTASQGQAVLHAVFNGYQPMRGAIERRRGGALVSMTGGEAVAFAIWNLQERAAFFVGPGEPLYEGMIVAEHVREGDLVVNVTKAKKLTNVRSSGADDAIQLVPPRRLSLEQALEWIDEDEFVEVTPKRIRLRKGLLKEHQRKRAARED